MIFVLNEHHSVANHFLLELRDHRLQNDRLRFRRNLERLGEIMAYEISKQFIYSEQTVQTPLGTSSLKTFQEQPVLITILRAGLPYFQGFVNIFDRADCGFIGAYRQEDANHLTIKLNYAATPSLEQRTVILIDPMLATGRSVVDTVNAIIKNGNPKLIHIASLVAAPEGLDHLKEKLKVPYKIWTCAIDERLDENFYIVPGLGDAGDLSFGTKL